MSELDFAMFKNTNTFSLVAELNLFADLKKKAESLNLEYLEYFMDIKHIVVYKQIV